VIQCCGLKNARYMTIVRRVSCRLTIDFIDRPTLIFLDEPTTGLDATMAQTVVEILAQLAKRGRTIVLSIHQVSAVVKNTGDPSLYAGAQQQTTRNVCWKHLRTQSSGWWYK
jgi:ABC-type glutathione transport system ATPase component